MSRVTPPPRPRTEDLHVLPLGLLGNIMYHSSRKCAGNDVICQSKLQEQTFLIQHFSGNLETPKQMKLGSEVKLNKSLFDYLSSLCQETKDSGSLLLNYLVSCSSVAVMLLGSID